MDVLMKILNNERNTGAARAQLGVNYGRLHHRALPDSHFRLPLYRPGTSAFLYISDGGTRSKSSTLFHQTSGVVCVTLNWIAATGSAAASASRLHRPLPRRL